jgi:hypothetical protein
MVFLGNWRKKSAVLEKRGEERRRADVPRVSRGKVLY